MIQIPRFYKKEFPEIDEHILCSVKNIDENCIYFHLVEYNKEIFVPFKDLNESRGRKAKFRINKKFKINTNHIFYVTNNSDNIELSNRGIDEDTLKLVTENYNKRKLVINIFKDFLNNLKIDDETGFIDYANKTIWKFDEKEWYDKIIDIKLNNNLINIFDINDKEKEVFIKYINHSINDIKYELIIEIQMFSISIDGINIIKEYLDKISNIFVNFDKDIKLINVPEYKIVVSGGNLDDLTYSLDAFSKIEKEISTDDNIIFNIKSKSIINNLNSNIINY